MLVLGVINNAGRAYRAPASATSLEEFRSLLEINLLAAFALAEAAYEELRNSGGTVVNVSSITSHRVLPNRLAYGSTKAALDHLTRSLAVEWGPAGIRVNGVLPWFTRTEMVKKVLENAAFEQDLIAATPLGRLAEPADIARVAAFLALRHRPTHRRGRRLSGAGAVNKDPLSPTPFCTHDALDVGADVKVE
jgi:NAD(P)-dependent dehydrogenase (short-subunit alcohol dehydrogenase family)